LRRLEGAFLYKKREKMEKNDNFGKINDSLSSPEKHGNETRYTGE
jgi:hypothetical protein